MHNPVKACLVLGNQEFRNAVHQTLDNMGITAVYASFFTHAHELTDGLIIQGILVQLLGCTHDRIKYLIGVCNLYPRAKVMVAFRSINQQTEKIIRTQRIVFLGDQDSFLQRKATIIKKAIGCQ